MSTLRTNRIEFGDASKGVATDYVVNGSAKAHVAFTAVTATLVIGDSLNISSMTDNGAGNYTNNFTNAFSTAIYGMAGSGGLDNGSGGWTTVCVSNATAPLATAQNIYTAVQGVGLVDGPQGGGYNSVVNHGDLA